MPWKNMLHQETIRKIEEFVYAKPRSIQEIALHIRKSWRTTDRYRESIEKEFGTIATRVFREGTRGALKVVYWASAENVKHSIFQEQLAQKILNGRTKEDFSAFDIFQHIAEAKKKVEISEAKNENHTDLAILQKILESTQKQLLIFSGNLSFINLKNKEITIWETIEKLAKRGVSIKTISRVDIPGEKNIQKMLSLNFKIGKENIEIRHCEQPLRCLLIDHKILRIKESYLPTGKQGELQKEVFAFYTIKEKDWIDWLSRIFWKIFSSSMGAGKRLEEIKKISKTFK